MAAARSTAAAPRPAVRPPRPRRRTRACAPTTCRPATRSSSTPPTATIGGLFTVGGGGDATKPFITNATGVATGLNADRRRRPRRSRRSSPRRARRPASTPTPSTAGTRPTRRPRFAQVTRGRHASATRAASPTTARRARRRRAASTTLAFTGDLAKCALSATLTDAAAGEIAATPDASRRAKTTTSRSAPQRRGRGRRPRVPPHGELLSR